MTDFLPKALRDELAAAHKSALRRKSRLRVRADGQTHPVLRLWARGFALDAENAPRLRGLVDIYDGSRHLYQALIVTSSEEDGELRFEFKRSTAAADRAPLDFYRPEDAPVGLLPNAPR